jgi:hypothetical protein
MHCPCSFPLLPRSFLLIADSTVTLLDPWMQTVPRLRREESEVGIHSSGAQTMNLF